MNENEVLNTEIVATSMGALETLEKASIDTQIATAKQYPRSLARFKENAIAVATLDEETAASCIYRRPVGEEWNPVTKKKEQKYAEGLSVRMAEIVAASYGNLRVGARIVEQTERQVVAQGIAHDLESNFLSTSEVVESTMTSDKNGKPKPYSERMRIVVAKAALAKARRDAIFQVMPRALAKPVEKAVKELLFGNSASITKWRNTISAWVKTLGISEKRVWAALNIEGADDLKQSEIEILIGIKTALQNGDTDLDTAFPELENSGNFMQPVKKAKTIETPQTDNTKSASKEKAAENVTTATAEVISEGQKQRLVAIAEQNELSKDEMSFLCYSVAGVNNLEEIPKAKYNDVVSAYEEAEPGKVIPA